MSDRLAALLKFVAAPADARLRIAKSVVGRRAPLPWCDDGLIGIAIRAGLLEQAPLASQADATPGDLIATDDNGNLTRTQLTAAGWRAAEATG